MDYIWSVPAVGNAQSQQYPQSQAPSLQYPQNFPVFDPYFMWQQQPRMTGSYDPMYTYVMHYKPSEGYKPTLSKMELHTRLTANCKESLHRVGSRLTKSKV